MFSYPESERSPKALLKQHILVVHERNKTRIFEIINE